MKTFALPIALFFGFITHNAHADTLNTHWSVVASACVPEPGTASLATFDSGLGSVTFASGQTGSIKLNCPVSGLFTTTNGSNADRLNIVFFDSDTTNDTCYVGAYLYRRSVHNGGVSATLIRDYNGVSDSALNGASPYSYRNWESESFTHTFSFDDNFYWVQVILARSATSCNVEVVGVNLTSTIQ